MKIINIHETHLLRLAEKAREGFAIGAPNTSEKKRVGFMASLTSVPDDFDQIGRDEIEALFNGDA